MANISQPPAFLPEAGEPHLPWKQWISGFENYILALDGDKYSANRKKALLLHCLGMEGQRIFNTLPARTAPPAGADDYANAVHVLNEHFSPSVNVVAERYRFRQRGQNPGEHIHNFIAALRELSKTCNFGTMEDEMIRDQVVEKTSSHRVRERLLMEKDLTLTKTIELALRIEEAVRESKALGRAPNSDPMSHSVNKVIRKSGPKGAGRGKPPVQCYRCGKGHLANDVSCKAKDRRCNKCKKIGHFSVVCHANEASGQFTPRRRSNVNHVQTSGTSADYADDVQDLEVLATNVSKDRSKGVYCTVKVSDVPLKLLVDTGSAVSILSKSTFENFFLSEALEEAPPGVKLSSYTEHTIDMVGCLTTTVLHLDRSVIATLYVVENGKNILGRDLVKGLGINIDGSTLSCNKIDVSNTNVPKHVECFKHMFVNDSDVELSKAKGFIHKVKVDPDVKPKQQKLRRLPFSVRDKVSDELKKLEASGVIEKIESSEWVSPIVVAWKKSGKIRICVDLREVNKAIVQVQYPLPKIDELLGELRDAKVFTQLDLASAYHQIELHPESRPLTAFITHDGLYQYKRVCFGLSSAPSVFQRSMSHMLAGLVGVQCYLDDVIVYGSTVEEHNANLKCVLSKLDSHGIKLNQKCQFNQDSLHVLGHTVSEQGIHIDDKYTSITNAPVPRDCKSLRSFLGLAGYFSKYVPNFSVVVEPLREVLRDGSQFVWSEQCQGSFDKVKQVIGQSPILAMFDPRLEVVVRTDASHEGLGACLNQIKDGQEVTVSFASRTLSHAERNYSVGEKEALACVWACEKWHVYLWGRKFKLCTDHKALVTLLSKGSDRQSMRIARWACRLMRYNYDMCFTKGTDNVIADALSRLSVEGDITECDDDSEMICHICEKLSNCMMFKEFEECCNSDQTFSVLKGYMVNGWPKLKHVDECAKPYYKVQDELCVSGNVIMRGDRLVVPSELTPRLLELAHESHQGMTRTKQRLRELYWWPLMDQHVENMVKHCHVCQYNDKSVKQQYQPMQPVLYPESPWDKVSMDIVGPFEKGPKECRFAVTIVDLYSKWPEVCFTPEVTTSKVLGFMKQIFSREGFPNEIVTDNGVQFRSNEYETFLSERGIKHRYSSLYYPQANGAIERFNSVLKNCVQNAINTGRPWKETVMQFLGVYRATAHAATGTPPSVLLHGRNMRTKLNLVGRVMPNVKVDKVKVRQKVEAYQTKYKKRFDEKKNVKETKICVGDWVKVKKPGFVSKGYSRYSEPIQITQKVSNYTFKTSDGRTWNVSKMVKCSNMPDVSDNAGFTDFDVNNPNQAVHNDMNVAQGVVNNDMNVAPRNVVALRRSNRESRPPPYLADYVRY